MVTSQVPQDIPLTGNNTQVLQDGGLQIQLGVSTSLADRSCISGSSGTAVITPRVLASPLRSDDSMSEPEYDFCSIARQGDHGDRQGPVVNIIAIVVNNPVEPQNQARNLQGQDTPTGLDRVNGILNFDSGVGFVGYMRDLVYELFTGTLIELFKGWILNNLQS